MPRERTGSVRIRKIEGPDGKRKELIYARVTYIDLSGKRKTIERRADSRTHAKALNRQIIQELDEQGARGIDARRMTFAQLAAWFTGRYLVPAQYVENRKISGRRTHEEAVRVKNVLVKHLGAARICEITHDDLERYKQKRLADPVIHKKKDGTVTATRQRSIRSVNIEMSLLRRMFSVAQREGWIIKTPFRSGDSLISAADEVQRQRILTRDEEERLLAACEGPRRHLRSILICALDTGMRKGELFKLRWAEVDLIGRIIRIQAFNTKTMREREVSMSSRVARELGELWATNQPKPDDLVFGIEHTIKRSFKTACQLAKITGFRFHDTRHTHATRMIEGGMALASVARRLGHEQITTTYRYVNPTPDAGERAVDILDRLQEEPQREKVN